MPRRARRSFTPEFKARVVLDLLRGERSQAELCRLHQLGASLLALWKDAFLDRLPLVFQADERVMRTIKEEEVDRRSTSTTPTPCGS